MSATTITTTLLDFLEEKLKDYGISNFYQEIRDDSKTKSITIYSLSNAANTQNFGTQICHRADYQIQVVFGKSVSETEALADYIYKNIVMSNEKYTQNDYQFYITPLQNRIPRYLGTLGNGCHKYGIDVLVAYNK